MARVFAATVATAAAGGTVNLTFEDCGDASTVGTIKDLQPRSLSLGGTTTLVGSGTLTQDIAAGDFSFTAKALGVTVLSDGGDLCQDKAISLPLGVGSFNYKSAGCPVKAGDVDLTFEATLSAAIPSQIAKLDINVAATGSDGTKALCATIHTSPGTSFKEIAERVNSLSTTWTAQEPSKFANVEDVKPFLGAILPGQEGYEEPPVMEIAEANGGVPDAFDSATNWPQCAGTIANVRDQSACGSCWAFGSVESFEDRACIATGKVVHYSPEDTAFNSNAGMGCNGGNTAWNWFKSTGVVTGGDYTDIGSGDTCLPYSLAPCAHHVPPSAKYPACPGEGPSPVPGRKCSESGYAGAYASDKLKAQSAFSVRGVSQIQTEIMTNGPLYVSFTVYDDFPTYKSGVYHATSFNVLGGHAVENVGWGSLDGQAYWRIKNSWNEQWGDGGHFKIVRGTNECGIEGGVSGGLISGSPAPAPTPTPPGPAPAGGSHYEKPPCSDDELQGDVTDASGATVGSVCAPECDMSGQCPQDVPEGAAALPMCALQDSDTGKQYCALSCYLDSGCPSEASCAMIGGIFGVCLYPESATNGHKFVVANAATV